MVEYLGNTFSLIEKAVAEGKKGITLDAAQMQQVIAEQAALIEKNNELVRESNALREANQTSQHTQGV